MPAIISIITPNFNRADLLGETAESILQQDYPHWEWVVVDDGSSDNSPELIQELSRKDARIRFYHRHKEPKGAGTCRNIAVEKSTGSYLIFLGTDDLLAPNCLRQRLKAIEEDPSLDYVVFPTILFKKRPDDLKLLWNIENGVPEIDRLLKGDPICQGTGTIWKKESFLRIGGWDETLALWQDVEFHLRAHLEDCRYRVRFDLPPDVYIRITEQSLSRAKFHSYPKQESRVRVLIQSAKRMHQKGILQRHLPAMQELSRDLLFSSIKNRHFDLAHSLLDFTRDLGLIVPKERKKFELYCWLEKTRLLRFPGLDRLLRNSWDYGNPAYQSFLGKKTYEGQLAF